ncbi:MAG: hypothetical protein R3B47_20205 [Bacteroidia bacterium]
MTLSKKKSRLITVYDNVYRWAISPGPENGKIIFIAEMDGVKGRKIEVTIDSDVDRFWTYFSDVQDLNMRVIKPQDVSSIIHQAISLGWTPEEKGSPLRFDLVGDKLFVKE